MKKNVVILDNRSYVRYRIKLAMDENLYEVYEASNSMELFMKLKELTLNVDVIVMEINLNNEDGFEIIRALRKRNINIPIMVLSELNTRNDVIKSFKMGATDYFLKPFSDELISKRIVKNLEVKNKDKISKEAEIKNHKDYIDSEIKKAKDGGYNISIIMSIFYKLDNNNTSESNLDIKYLTLTDYIYEKIKNIFIDSNMFFEFGIQTFLAIYIKYDEDKISKVLQQVNKDFNQMSEQDEKIKGYYFKNISSTYPEDGSSYSEIINNIKDKIKTELTHK